MITTLVFLLILGILVFIHELGHFLAARRVGVRVEEFAFGFRPRILAKKVGETVYAFNLIPLGGYVRMFGEDKKEKGPRSYSHKTVGQRLFILVAGATMNLLLGWVILSVLFIVGFQPLFPGVGANPFVNERPSVAVKAVNPNSPASAAGLVEGDQILAIDGQTLGSDQEFITDVKAKNGQPISLRVKSVGVSNRDISITPRQNPPSGEGALGILITSQGQVRSQWYKAPLAGLYETGRIIGLSVVGFVDFVTGLVVHQKVSENVTGLVGVGVATGVLRHMGIIYLAQLVLLVSIGLGVVNLMPIMPLDGGHIAALFYEKIARRPLTDKQLGYLISGGLAFVLLMFVLVTYKDVIRFNILSRIF